MFLSRKQESDSSSDDSSDSDSEPIGPPLPPQNTTQNNDDDEDYDDLVGPPLPPGYTGSMAQSDDDDDDQEDDDDDDVCNGIRTKPVNCIYLNISLFFFSAVKILNYCTWSNAFTILPLDGSKENAF